jgi:hypothetical protein
MDATHRAALATVALLLAGFGLRSHAVAAPTPGDPHDITGLWMNDNTLDEVLRREGKHRLAPGEAEPPPPGPPPMTPEYKAIYDSQRHDAEAIAEGAQACHWEGMPGIMTYPYPFEFLITPGRITMIFEADSQVRRIWMDRSKHLGDDDLEPTYYGDSIGHWEGDTLVVDTIGFNTETTVRGAPHSDQMHITERWRHTAKDTIQDVMTITDPKAFTKPMVTTLTFSRRPGWRIREYSCTENNRDKPDASGQRSGGVVAPQAGPTP